MKNTKMPNKQIQDKLGKRNWPFFSGRDKSRTHMQWDSSVYSGFSNCKPWLKINSKYQAINVVNSMSDKNSIWQVYKKLIELRNSKKILQKGDWNLVPCKSKKILAYKRSYKNKELVIIINFNRNKQSLSLLNEHEIIFNTHEIDMLEKGMILGYQGMIIKSNRSVFHL